MLCAILIMDVHVGILKELDTAIQRYSGDSDTDHKIGPICAGYVSVA